MINVFKLGYADFSTKDIEAMIHYYTEVMGFTLVDRGDDGTAYISSGVDHHNIVLSSSGSSCLQRVGWQVDEKLSLQEIAKQLKDQGIAAELKTDAQPGVPELLELNDPDENIIQLYPSMKTRAPGFHKSGIVPNKLGHIALCVKDAKKVVSFYKEILGFRETDWIGNVANFLTCNREHHTLNIVQAKGSLMHHIAFELRGASHQYDSSDWLAKNNIPILWGPSRHTAGHNIASYHHDPDQHIIELFTDMDIYIPELDMMEPRPWHETLPQKPKVWEELSAWGTMFKYDLGEAASREE